VSIMRKNGKHYSSLRVDDHCTECGCVIALKTRCMSCECPLGKWLAELTEELENKLEEYEKEIKKNDNNL